MNFLRLISDFLDFGKKPILHQKIRYYVAFPRSFFGKKIKGKKGNRYAKMTKFWGGGAFDIWSKFVDFVTKGGGQGRLFESLCPN